MPVKPTMSASTTRASPRRGLRLGATAWVLLSLALWTVGCVTTAIRPPSSARYQVVPMELTGYCNCGKCCNWRRSWLGLGDPVIASGPRQGAAKQVGLTASGTTARHGTLAADITRYPFGTVIEIPGYGVGRVEDTGGAIKGDHLDLWFSSHDEATQFGKQRRLVKIWLPSNAR